MVGELHERGEMIPGSKVLTASAKALDVTIAYLVSPQQARLQKVDFRKKASTSAKGRARVEAEVLQAVERYLQIEQILGMLAVQILRARKADRASLAAPRSRPTRDRTKRPRLCGKNCRRSIPWVWRATASMALATSFALRSRSRLFVT